MRCAPKYTCSLLVAFFVASAATARADLVSTLSLGGPALHSGSTTMQPTDQYLSVDIDYAVFDPGTWRTDQFKAITDIFGNTGTVDGAQYLYAYQITDAGTESSVGVHSFAADVSGDVTALGYVKSTGIPTLVGGLAISGAQFSFVLVPATRGGQTSPILLLQSPDGPDFLKASIQGGGHTADGLLPVPISAPAPSAALLVVLGVAMALFIKGPRAVLNLQRA